MTPYEAFGGITVAPPLRSSHSVPRNQKERGKTLTRAERNASKGIEGYLARRAAAVEEGVGGTGRAVAGSPEGRPEGGARGGGGGCGGGVRGGRGRGRERSRRRGGGGRGRGARGCGVAGGDAGEGC